MSDRPSARPKGWRRTDRAVATADNEAKETAEDQPTHAAPGHQGGSFAEADPRIASSRGGFGFRVWS